MTKGNLGREWLISSYTHESHPGRSGEDWRREGVCWDGWCGVRDLRAPWLVDPEAGPYAEAGHEFSLFILLSTPGPPAWRLAPFSHPTPSHPHSPAGHLGIQTTISPKLGYTQHLRRESPRFKVPLPRCALVYANLTRTDQHS